MELCCYPQKNTLRVFEIEAISIPIVYNKYGVCLLQSFGDMRNHRYHGLFGMIIIEPPASRWYSFGGLGKGDYKEQAVITTPAKESFREFVLFIQNGIRLLDKDGQLIKTASGEEGEEVDHEDTGEKGYNYRSEPFKNRLKKDKRVSKVFSSRIHGDPSTPVFLSYPGERVLFRVGMPADKPRNTGFAIHDHLWREQPHDPRSRIIPLQGAKGDRSFLQQNLKSHKIKRGSPFHKASSFICHFFYTKGLKYLPPLISIKPAETASIKTATRIAI